MLGISPTDLLNLIVRLMVPLTRLALKNGIHVRELEECLKRSLVDVAKKELELSGERCTVSRLSVMTGIHRKDIDRLKEAPPSLSAEESLISRVVGHWQTDRRFITKEGKPRVLTFGFLGSAFGELVESISKELNPATVLFELERTGVVERSPTGIKLLTQSYSPSDKVEYGLTLLADDCGDLMESVQENLSNSHTLPNLHARTVFDKIREEDLDELRSWLKKEGHALHLKARIKLSKLDQEICPKSHYAGKFVKVILGTFSRIVKEP